MAKTTRYDGSVIVIVGATGAGKTGVAIDLVLRLEGAGLGLQGGEIISADSRAIYRGMDIGTAKPSLVERRGVVHYGFDLVEPNERFTVADWKLYAEERIEAIRQAGKVPIVVGGTGLYVDALVFDYKFTQLVQKSCSDRLRMSSEYKIYAIEWGRDELRERIQERLNKLFTQELYDETVALAQKYDWQLQAMRSNIYQFVWQYLQGEISLERARELAFYDDWHLAKRQLTWFKRNPEIKWLKVDELVPTVLKCIQDEQRN